MTPEEALALVEGAIAPSTLNKVQRSVFRAAWQGLSYGEMAQKLDYDFGYLRDVGSRLWQQLSTVLEQSVTKQNLTGVLQHYQQQGQEVIPVSAPAVALSSSNQDWGEAVDVSHFCGRVAELETLSQWMNQDRCRLVVIGGMGGIGKTMLSVKLAQTLQLDFDFILWRSLRDLPPLDKLLGSMLRFLLPDTLPVAAALDEKLGQFQDVLHRHRCLIVLDNFDALFAPGQGLGVFSLATQGLVDGSANWAN